MTTTLVRALRLLSPLQSCRYCALPSTHGALCPACANALQDSGARCFRCALPLTDPAGICGECLANPPHFERTLCADSYRPPISQWLQNFKDRRDLRDGHLLVQRLIDTVNRSYTDQPDTKHNDTVHSDIDDNWAEPAPLPEYLIPVPLHWRKALWRNFNQASWLSQQLQQHFRIPVLQAVQRTRSGNDQRQLTRQQRQRSLHGVYRLRADYQARLQNRHVAVVDDVITTTATARAISRELRRHGVGRVDIWCLARTGKSHHKH